MQSTMNYTQEAAKVLNVLAAFEAEIKRLTTENESLIKENQELKLQLTLGKVDATTSYSSSWEVPPEETEEFAEKQEEIQEQAKQHKRRGPNKPAQQETRCNALIPVLELNIDGELVPSQCKRSSESCGFCKQHAEHQTYGTIENPNTQMLKKQHHLMEKAYNKKNGIVETKKKAKKPKSDVKRKLNPYMMFLQVNREKVKEELMTENPQLKGKELAMAITRHVGRLWQNSKGNTSAEDDFTDDSTEYSETEVEAELDQMLGCC
jgi:hypothetical protein